MAKKRNTELYNKILELVNIVGLNPTEAARKVGVPERTARDWVKGRSKSNKTKEKSKEVLKKDLPVPDRFNFEVFNERVKQKVRELEHFDPEGKTCFVYTGCINDTLVNKEFFGALVNYCLHKNAKLMIQPIKYDNPKSVSGWNASKTHTWDPIIKDYVLDKEVKIIDKLRLLGDVNVNATSPNPLSSFNQVSHGDSVFFAHPRLEFEHVAVLTGDSPAQIGTTGVINDPFYSESKLGYMARNSHSMSAIVFDVDFENNFFLKTELCFDGKGFFDKGYYYTKNTVDFIGIEALVCGDIHVGCIDPVVADLTFFDEDSICKTLKPKHVILHDTLDFRCQSHHDRDDGYLLFEKAVNGTDSVLGELMKVGEFYQRISFANMGVKFHEVSSNHDKHFYKYLNTTDIKSNPKNSLIYHKMWYMMLNEKSTNPFKLWMDEFCDIRGIDRLEFRDGSQSFKLGNFQLCMHGDIGSNGSRGSVNQYSKYHELNISGHSHTGCKKGNAWKAGTSTKKRIGYNNEGASNWTNTHIVVNGNGTAQSITIIEGKWKL